MTEKMTTRDINTALNRVFVAVAANIFDDLLKEIAAKPIVDKKQNID